MSDSTIASISIPTHLDLSGIKTDLAKIGQMPNREIEFKTRFNLSDITRQIQEVQALANSKTISFKTTLDTDGIKKQLQDLDSLIKRINASGQSVGSLRGQSPIADIERQRIALQKLQIERIKAEASITSAKGGDSLALRTQAGILAEMVRYKERLVRLDKLGIDTSSVSRAKSDLDRLFNANTERLKIKPSIDTSGIKSQLRTQLSDIGSGIAQGIGQQLTQGLTSALTGALSSVGSTVSSSIGQGLTRAMNVERVKTSLEIVLGSASEATTEMEFLDAASRDFNTTIDVIAPNYLKMSAAMRQAGLPIEEVRNITVAVLTMGQQFGLTQEQIDGVFLAIQQIVSKGKVSMEEINQLNERIPGATGLLAKAYNMSVAEFTKAVAAGEIAANSLIPQFSRVATSGVDTSKALGTTAAKIQEAQAAIARLQLKFGEGLSPAVSAGADLLADVLLQLEDNDAFSALNAEAQRFADFLKENPQYVEVLSQALNELLSSGLKFLVDKAEEFLKHLKENPDAIKQATRTSMDFLSMLSNIANAAISIGSTLGGWGAKINEALDRLEVFGVSLKDILTLQNPILNPQGFMDQVTGKNQGGSTQGKASVSQEFVPKLKAIAQDLGMNPEHLLAAMLYESAGTLSPSIRGVEVPGQGKATGLIQFMPETARRLGTSSEALAGMTQAQQLDYVKKYFEPFKGQFPDFYSVYATIHGGHPRANPNASDGYRTTGQAAQEAQANFGAQARTILGQGSTNLGTSSAGLSSGVTTGGISSASRSAQFTTLNKPAPSLGTSDKPVFPIQGQTLASTKKAGLITGEVGDPRSHGSHQGQDYAYPKGTPVLSALDGVITKVDYDADAAGNYVEITSIQDGKQTVTRYLHLDSVFAKENAQVKKGTPIGTVGSTGAVSTGNHLHFEVWKNGKLVNPEQFLSGATEGKLTNESLAQQLTSEEDARKKAQESAQRELERKDRQRNDRINAERRQRDEALKLERQGEDQRLQTAIERQRDPIIKSAMQNDFDKRKATRDYDDQIQKAKDDRADLVRGRDLKVALMKAGKDAGELSGIDFTAMIKKTDEAIAKLEQLRKTAIAPLEAQRQNSLIDIVERQKEGLGSLSKSLNALRAQYLDETPATRYAARLQQMADAHNEITKQIQEQIKTQKALIQVQDTPENRAHLAALEAKQSENDRAFLQGKDRLDRDSLREQRDRAFDNRQREQASFSEIANARIGLGQTYGLDTSGLQRQQALDAEATRFENVVQGLIKLREEGQITDEELKQLKGSALELNAINLENIREQFNEFQGILRNDIQPAFTGFFSDVIRGTSSIGEAFSNMLGKMADSLINFGLNKLMGSLFGGLMGGGGGMFGGNFFDIGKPVVNLLGFSEGGIIPGIRSKADDQLILAQRGEAILTHRAVDLLGERTISLINKGRLPQFSEGGIVGRSTLGLTSMPTVANRSINSGTIDKPAVAQTITNNSSVSVTINSDGSADVRGDRGDKLGSMLSNAVKAILIQESRPGGIIGSQR